MKICGKTIIMDLFLFLTLLRNVAAARKKSRIKFGILFSFIIAKKVEKLADQKERKREKAKFISLTK